MNSLNINAVLARLVVVKRSFTCFFSFDVEVENTARIQNVLADELSPIKSTLDLTGDNVMQVSQCSIAEGLTVKQHISTETSKPLSPLLLVKLRNRALKFLVHFSSVCQAISKVLQSQ